MKMDPGLISSASVAAAWIFLSSPITCSIHVIKMASWATTATVHPQGEVKVKTVRGSGSSLYVNACRGEEKESEAVL